MKTWMIRASLACIISAFVISPLILIVGWKKCGPSDGLGKLLVIGYALGIGIVLLVFGIILLLVSIFIKV